MADKLIPSVIDHNAKAFISKVDASPKYAKFFHWGKLITITGGAQVLIQAVGLISGILVIRLLPTNEYAWYTLANTMLGTLTVLADGGISTGVMANGGRCWQDKKKLGEVLATGLSLRRKFAVISLLISLPILIYLLLQHGASPLTTILIVASLIPAFFAALSDSLLEIIPRLHQDIPALQKNQISVSIGRLLLTVGGVFVFPFTYIAILASGLPRSYGNIRLRKIAGAFVDRSQHPNKKVQKDILRIVRRILPGSVFYCLSGQLTIWLVSILGTTASLAEVGALGRIATVLSIFGILFSTLIIPRFARLATDKKLLLKRYSQISILLLGFGLAIVSLSAILSKEALYILGPHYAHLKPEFILSIIGACIGLIGGTLFALNNSRGWTINPLINIPINIIATIIGIIFLNLSTLSGIFVFNIWILSIEVVIHAAYGFWNLYDIHP